MRYWQPLGGENSSDTLPAASWKWVSTERQQFLPLQIQQSRHRADIRAHRRTIERLDMQQCNISKEKQWFQNNWCRNLLNMQKQVIGCWIHDFDKPLLLNCKIKSLIWIYEWTCWATCWQPTQLWRVVRFPSNPIQVDGSGVLTTWTSNLTTVQFGPRPRLEVMVRNRC